MPERRKKIIPTKETGTVPKVKSWNNTTVQQDTHVSNNLSGLLLPNQERCHSESRNRQRCSNYHCFEGVLADDHRVFPNYNSLPYMNMSGSTTSPSTSGSTSRRQSGGAIRKCDNIAKCPDKKHIEDKLNQIREYLKVTSSMMTSVKEDQSRTSKSNDNDETDELYQLLSALRDSERKLEAMLMNREVEGAETNQDNVEDAPVEASVNGNQTLDAEPVFPTFQNNVTSLRNELEEKMEISEMKLLALHEQQSLLMRLQEKAENQLKDARKAQQKLATCADNIQCPLVPQQMLNFQSDNKNSDKNKCFDQLQSSDSESHTEQLNLLQSTNESRGQLLQLLDARDIELCNEQQNLQQKMQELSSKKRQIDQLVSQLQSYGNCGDGSEDGDDMANQIRQIVAMKEQLATLKDMLSTVKSTEAALLQQNCMENSDHGEQATNVKSANVKKGSSLVLSDIDSRSDSERRWGTMGKQSNKSSISSSREQLQAELQAKKQELEELMYKDQDRTSAINQDVCNEIVMNKGEPAFSLDSVPSSWTLLQDTPPRDSCVSRENVYSSDEEELENYSQLNNSDIAAKSADYVHCNFQKQIPNRQEINCNPTVQDAPSTPSGSQNFNQQWSGIEYKQQMELMMSLCQSLLEQQRQVVPSQLSVSNMQWFMSYMQMQQALMLSTVSQCCQLVWLQQQDITALINTVNTMQQRPKPLPTINHSGSDTVGSACSLPTRLPSTNTEYASLEPRGRPLPQNHNRPMGGLNQSPQPIWRGGQALNNQVAPGNRANNYWDNFRSYSRQNLLSSSTKSNEGSQNSLPMFDRLNTVGLSSQTLGVHRPSTISVPKINTPIQESVSPMETNNYESQREVRLTNRSERTKPKTKPNHTQYRNRNEWNEKTPPVENLSEKTKLFEDLRDNVYKEVTLLISANENRPHFLIQLFRDLQLISSDPLRKSTLHSIQTLITNSLSENAVNVRSPTSGSSRNKIEKSSSRCCALPNHNNSMPKLESDPHYILIQLLPFLKSHNENVFDNGLIDMIKMMIFQLLPVKYSSSSNKFHAKLDSIFTEALLKFKGKRVSDIRQDMVRELADILLQEMSAPKEQQSTNENIPETLLFLADPNNRVNSLAFEPFQYLPIDQKSHPNYNSAPRIDNGDLAEADQSRREAENDEGAVGGMLLNSSNPQANSNHEVERDSNEMDADLEMFMRKSPELKR